MMETASTTTVEAIVVFRSGHTTLPNSALASVNRTLIFVTFQPRKMLKWQARRDSNPQHPDLESGALPIRATGLHKQLFIYLLRFFVRRMLTAETTVLAQLQLTGSVLLVLRGVVVAPFTLGAAQRYLVSHNKPLSVSSVPCGTP